MCTSHVAGNTQRLVSMGKLRKCQVMGLSRQIARYDKDVVEVTVLGDVDSLAKMSGGDDDVEPYLYSRNTIGHGNHNPKSQRPKRVKSVKGGSGKGGGACGKRRWYAKVCVGTGAKLGEKKVENGAEDGVATVRGRMSGLGSGDERDEHREERLKPGEIRRNLWMEIGEKWMES